MLSVQSNAREVNMLRQMQKVFLFRRLLNLTLAGTTVFSLNSMAAEGLSHIEIVGNEGYSEQSLPSRQMVMLGDIKMGLSFKSNDSKLWKACIANRGTRISPTSCLNPWTFAAGAMGGEQCDVEKITNMDSLVEVLKRGTVSVVTPKTTDFFSKDMPNGNMKFSFRKIHFELGGVHISCIFDNQRANLKTMANALAGIMSFNNL